MKKSLIKIIALVLLLSQLMVMSSFATTSETTTLILTEEQKEAIYEEIEKINSKYEIGEPFNKEDRAFIEKYIPLINKKSSEIGLMAESEFYNSKTSSDGLVTAVIAGKAISEVNVFNHVFGADYTTVVHEDGREYLEEIECRVNCTAYGIVGSDGAIGKIYEKTLTASTDEYVIDFDEIENYSGGVLYSVVNVKSVITYQYGSFSVNAPF